MKELSTPNLDEQIKGIRVSESMMRRIDEIGELTGLSRSMVCRIALAFFFFAFDQIRERGRITI